MELNSWFIWALVSTFFFGSYSFLFKKIVEEGGDVFAAQVVMPAVVCFVSASIIYLFNFTVGDNLATVAGIAVLQGVLFFLSTYTRIKALGTGLPVYVVFPITKTSTILIVIISAFVFSELEILKKPEVLAGVILAMAATYLLLPWHDKGVFRGSSMGIVLSIASMLSSAGATIAAKSALDFYMVNIFVFILLSNVVTLVLATATVLIKNTTLTQQKFSNGIKWGVMMGLFNFAGFASFLQAVKLGNLSVVASVNALYILIPIVLSAIIYKESMSLMKWLAVAISIAAVILMKIGATDIG